MSIRNARARELARRGEERAARYVEELGWQVLDRNWRCRTTGELDIVAFDPAEGTYVFVEVKTRSGTAFGHPLDSITPAKANRLRGLAMSWLAERRARGGHVRIDGIGIVMPPGGPEELSHVRGVGES